MRVAKIQSKLAKATFTMRMFRKVQQERWEKETHHEFKGAPRLTWQEMQKDFAKIWEHTKRAKRFEIHVINIPLDEIRRLSETVSFGSDPSLADAERVFCVFDP